MQIQELSRISKVFTKPWIFLEFLESAWILGFFGKSLLKGRMAEMILGKCEFKKIYHIFVYTHNKCQIIPQCIDSYHTSSHPFTPPTLPLHLSMKLTDISNTYSHLPGDCHTPWQLSHIPKPLLTSSIIIVIFHQMTHLSIPFTPYWGLSQFLTTVTSSHTPLHLPHDHHTSQSTESNF